MCLRYAPAGRSPDDADGLTRRIHQRVNAGGRVCVSHTVTAETGYVIRVSIGNIHTRPEDIDVLWHELTGAAAAEEEGQEA